MKFQYYQLKFYLFYSFIYLNELIVGRGTNRIIGGSIARPNLPYSIVIYRIYHSQGLPSITTPICSGNLISTRLILTALHCVLLKEEVINLDDLFVVGGQQIMNRFQSNQIQIRYIHRIIPHPLKKKNNLDYDLAILVTKKEFQLNPFVDIIQLSSINESPTNIECFTSGFGVFNTHFYYRYSSIIQQLQVEIVDYIHCKNEMRLTTSTNFCTRTTTNNIGECNGDSGGGIICRKLNGYSTNSQHKLDNFQLYGIDSWQLSCLKNKTFTVYQSVAANRLWIDGMIGNFN
ncbi:hypothetical protein SNEBB_006320 [Seison nebaliae]|nr:hypothetical protein SNEBB_006320 [Seison nebaliae]